MMPDIASSPSHHSGVVWETDETAEAQHMLRRVIAWLDHWRSVEPAHMPGAYQARVLELHGQRLVHAVAVLNAVGVPLPPAPPVPEVALAEQPHAVRTALAQLGAVT